MGLMDKIKTFIEPEGDDEFESEEVTAETPAHTTAAVAPARAQTTTTYERKGARTQAPLDEKTKMVLFEPRSFGEAEAVGSRLKEGRAVVVNLHKLGPDYARRTIDFLSGVVYALDGNVQKIGSNVILCYPSEIGVAGTINFGKTDDADSEENSAE